jgi:methyl-accepting chemotaxis protein
MARHANHPSCTTLRESAVRLQEHGSAFVELLNNGEFDLATQLSGKLESERDTINNQLAAMLADDLP